MEVIFYRCFGKVISAVLVNILPERVNFRMGEKGCQVLLHLFRNEVSFTLVITIQISLIQRLHKLGLGLLKRAYFYHNRCASITF
jgi:hypothetical protein